MPTIFDNSENNTLGGSLLKTFPEHQRIDVATGYFDLRGWGTFSDLVDAKKAKETAGPVARILVGMVAPSAAEAMLQDLQKQVQAPDPYAQIPDFESARSRQAQLVNHLREQLMRGLSTKEGQTSLRALKRQLQEGMVEIKVFTRRPLHGKAYVLHNPGHYALPVMGYLGSSNLTAAGLYSNLELNVDVLDQDAAQKLDQWFTSHWDDHFSLPITEQIIELIEESWAAEKQPTPFEVFLKVCLSMSQDVRDGFGYVLPPSMHKLLLDYQESAVRILARRIVRRGGTMLGDVVGLGKTLTAIATAMLLQSAEDYSTLVLCPKNLEDMWQKHLDAYDIVGRVVPYSMAATVLPELKRFQFVICDESHNLRTNTRKDYEAIKEYVRGNDSKVLLLTATPYNLAFEDVANQIGLYLDEDDDLGIEPLAALAKNVGLADKVDGKTNTLAAFRLSEESEDWKRLMSDHLVRRTRSFIKRTAQKKLVVLPDGRSVEREYLQFADGTPFFFPQRVAKPVSHDFDVDDPARLMEDDETLDAIKSLLLPRYVLAAYDAPKKRHTDEDLKILEDIKTGRGNVAGFVRTGLFKRLSSSGHSFVQSLQRQRARNDLYLHAIENRLPVPLGNITQQQFGVTDEDIEDTEGTHGTVAARYDHLQKHLPASTKWLNSTIFTDALRADLERDNATITWLLDRYGTWDPTKDSKINALVDLLTQQHQGEKVLVFTEYKDTADYIARSLHEAGIQNVGLATGDTGNPGAVARRFSPASNKLPGAESREALLADPIDVLIATDVLSEGQNLQDSHVVVNYDLPWAIIRLIQRAGRVDRIGQQSSTVYVYLISHEKVEEQISLRHRIKQRLESSAQAFGSDEQFFGTESEISVLDNFYSGRLEDESIADEEADAVSEAWLIWSNATEKHPDVTQRVLAMPDLVQSTRNLYINEAQGGVVCYVNTVAGVDAFAVSRGADDLRERERLITPYEAFKLFYAEPETPTAELREDHFERLQHLVHGPLSSEGVAAGNLKGVRKRVWERFAGTLFLRGAEDALNALHERPLQKTAELRLRAALRNRVSDEDMIAILNQLHEDDKLVIKSIDSDPVRVVCSLGVRN
ncbi:helicase-related protein [Arthrobacter bambusae]|uniref:helicase-related protein n=1 Tax=Arthrobacter bambusae TaxID=1338426 RepID=UPI002789DB6D|nr:helicase-related protein [Arthrobacter bambusae]MDQ0241391.1 superfamily II DNA or RNA helicase/HKD family nuclease [Arthrobacter bambusae]